MSDCEKTEMYRTYHINTRKIRRKERLLSGGEWVEDSVRACRFPFRNRLKLSITFLYTKSYNYLKAAGIVRLIKRPGLLGPACRCLKLIVFSFCLFQVASPVIGLQPLR